MKRTRKGFSLIEIMIAIAVVATLSFIMIANAPKWLGSGEDKRMTAFAATMNAAQMQFYQTAGRTTANAAWNGKSAEERYQLLAPFLYNPAPTLEKAVTEGYTIEYNSDITKPCRILNPEGVELAY